MPTHTVLWFAIYDKKSGAYLPRTKTRAGATWLEFSHDQPPRLFSRKQDAVSALLHWQKGKRTDQYVDVYDIHSGRDERKETIITARDVNNVDPIIVSVYISQC